MNALCYDRDRGCFLSYSRPDTVISVHQIADVLPALREVERLVNQRRLEAVGFISYEAAPAFDGALKVSGPTTVPLLCFGLYGRHEIVGVPPSVAALEPGLSWQPTVTLAEYRQTIRRLKELIRNGETYQVNYTFKLRASFAGEAWAWFARLFHAQGGCQACFLETERFTVCSASPELFFQLEGHTVWSRPMKGTAARGLTLDEDERAGECLRNSPKDRAENVMVVDMIRNDLGRIARPGSVLVPALFTLEKYPTVWQLTSTVTAQTSASVTEILTALFPCASITGAPKCRTMEIIRLLEAESRGIYTGALGRFGPDRTARFAVAIRTMVVDRQLQRAEYGVGGGIVWDSEADCEHAEALGKARVLAQVEPPFALMETLLWEPAKGYFLLEAHLGRMEKSARYFGFQFDSGLVRQKLQFPTDRVGAQPLRVRVVVDRRGQVSLTASPMAPAPEGGARPLRFALASKPVDPQSRFLYHKTTAREVYEAAAATAPGYDDVVLWNPQRELTETTIGNLVFCVDGRWLTPPVRCGLLPGVFRDLLIQQGILEEQVVGFKTARSAQQVFRINSVRRWEAGMIDWLDSNP